MPVVFFVTLNLFFLLPYVPADPKVFQQISEVDTRAVLVVTFVTIVLTGLLYNLNTPIVRMYEGYTWQYSFIGRWRTARYEAELKPKLELRAQAQDLQMGMARQNKKASPEVQKTIGEQSRSLNAIRNQLGITVNHEFPPLNLVLPTKLGNVIRSFESYPIHQFNMAGVTMYPRLIAVVDKEYAQQIDNAKSSLDFMINCSLLSAVLAVSLLVAGLVYPIPLSTPGFAIPWSIKIAFFFFLSWAFYVSSLGRAREWGDLVKGAFDLYRWKLLKQLGFERTPQSMEEERILWGEISAQVIYGDRRNARLLEYATPTTFARGEPRVAELTVSRGFNFSSIKNLFYVTVLVKNTDPQERKVEHVILTDRLPAGSEYLWGSAQISRGSGRTASSPLEELSPPGEECSSPVAEYSVSSELVHEQPIKITGSNPFRFEIGDLDYEEEVVVSYQVLLDIGKS